MIVIKEYSAKDHRNKTRRYCVVKCEKCNTVSQLLAHSVDTNKTFRHKCEAPVFNTWLTRSWI